MKVTIGSETDHRRWVWTGLVLAIVLDTVTQMTWKVAVMRLPTGGDLLGKIAVIATEPLYALLFILFLAQFINWMVVLGKSDVSYAQPITALSYVTVASLSTFYFGEHFTGMRGAGIGLILIGVWLISMTPLKTSTGQPRRTPQMSGIKP